jgi:pilus assembly protein Flp/PilA
LKSGLALTNLIAEQKTLLGNNFNQHFNLAILANYSGGNVMIKNFAMDFVKDEQGQDIVEYSLLLVLIGAAAIFVLTTMGQSISSIFNKINDRLTTANNSIS